MSECGGALGATTTINTDGRIAMLAGLIDAGKLQPVVGAVFPIAKARQAYEHKPARGKVALEAAMLDAR